MNLLAVSLARISDSTQAANRVTSCLCVSCVCVIYKDQELLRPKLLHLLAPRTSVMNIHVVSAATRSVETSVTYYAYRVRVYYTTVVTYFSLISQLYIRTHGAPHVRCF